MQVSQSAFTDSGEHLDSEHLIQRQGIRLHISCPVWNLDPMTQSGSESRLATLGSSILRLVRFDCRCWPGILKLVNLYLKSGMCSRWKGSLHWHRQYLEHTLTVSEVIEVKPALIVYPRLSGQQ